MKKRLLAGLLAAAMTFGLVACGGSGSKPESTQADSSEDLVEVHVIAAQYGQNTAEWWSNFVGDFEKDNPGIHLDVEVVSWNDIYTVVNTRIANGEAPDVLNIDVFADYQADNLLLPIQDVVSEETYAKMFPAFLEQSEVDGTVWAVPDLASARALYYNKDIFEKAGIEVPTTWDELTAACEALKKYDANIYPWGIDMTTDEGQAAFAYYTWNNGGGFVDADGNWTINSDANVEAVKYAVDLVNKGYTNSDPANDTRYDLQDMFGAGQLAMVIAPNSLPTYCKDGGYEVNYGVAAIPNNTGASVSAGVMDRFMCFDNEYDDAKKEAITKFFDYFYDDARYSDWVLMEGFLPATQAGAEAMVAADPEQASWIEILDSCQFYPTAKAEWADVKQGVIDVEQQALLGGDVKELLDNLQNELQ
ncbi:MAG: extracellular solute-binding protein [Eubacteriales bacterium]|nr:extracellular solute-binding protein [Eubacteriales bacterium]